MVLDLDQVADMKPGGRPDCKVLVANTYLHVHCASLLRCCHAVQVELLPCCILPTGAHKVVTKEGLLMGRLRDMGRTAARVKTYGQALAVRPRSIRILTSTAQPTNAQHSVHKPAKAQALDIVHVQPHTHSKRQSHKHEPLPSAPAPTLLGLGSSLILRDLGS